MALQNKQLIATWKGFPIQARQFTDNGKWFACQVKSEFPDAFIPRGKGIALNSDAVLANGVTAEQLAVLEASDDYGVQKPSSFITPTGYVERTTDTGTTYYVLASEENTDTDGDGKPDKRSGNFIEDGFAWIKANPLLAGGIVIGLYLLYKALKGNGRGRRKGGLASLF